jgi:hypothetical protein
MHRLGGGVVAMGSLRVQVTLVLALAGALAGCSLNPQPLPPDNPGDAAFTNPAGGTGAGDGGNDHTGDGSLTVPPTADAGLPPPVPGTDAGGDGETPAPVDGGDAATEDAPPGDAGAEDAGPETGGD